MEGGDVALELDAGMLATIETTLDGLTASHDLFELTAIDFGGRG